MSTAQVTGRWFSMKHSLFVSDPRPPQPGRARASWERGLGPDEIYQSANLYRSSCLFLSSFEVSCGLVSTISHLSHNNGASAQTTLTFKPNLNSMVGIVHPSDCWATWKMNRIYNERRMWAVVLLMEDFNYNVNHGCQCQDGGSEPWDAPDTWRPHHWAIGVTLEILCTQTNRTGQSLNPQSETRLTTFSVFVQGSEVTRVVLGLSGHSSQPSGETQLGATEERLQTMESWVWGLGPSPACIN